MATRRIGTLTIASAGQDSLKAGQLVQKLGKQLKGLILAMTLPIKNATGADIAAGALTAAQKRGILNCFQFRVSYGKDLKRKPFIAILGNRIRLEARDAYDSEIEGWTDVTGFGKAIPNGATTSVLVYLPIPLGRRADLPPSEQHLFGMGQSQAKTLEVQIDRISDLSGTANLTIDSAANVTMKMYPDNDSCNGDPVGLVPEYREKDMVEDEFTLDTDGLILRFGERTATMAASALTDFDVGIEKEEVYTGVSPAIISRELNDDNRVSAAGLITDEEVVLYKEKSGTPLRWRLTGRPKFRQNVKDLATVKTNVLYVPYLNKSQAEDEVQHIASKKVRGETIVVGSAFMQSGLNLPHNIAGLPFFNVWTKADPEFERTPGWTAVPDQVAPVLTVPRSVTDQAITKRRNFSAHQEPQAAERIERDLAVLIPGAVENGRGQGFSEVLNRIAQMVR